MTMNNTPTPPPGYRLIDPRKDAPKRWDDIYWSSVKEQWFAVNAAFTEYIGGFGSNLQYARRIEATAWIPFSLPLPADTNLDREYLVQLDDGSVCACIGRVLARGCYRNGSGCLKIIRWLDY